jgi:ABC-type multidrug transport system fused ATPase/permease subunit
MVSVEQAALRDLRNQLHAHLQRQSLSFFHARRTGNLMSRLTSDFDYLRMALAATTSTAVKDGLTLIGSLVLAFHRLREAALLSLIVLPPAAVAFGAIGRRCAGARPARRSGWAS